MTDRLPLVEASTLHRVGDNYPRVVRDRLIIVGVRVLDLGQEEAEGSEVVRQLHVFPSVRVVLEVTHEVPKCRRHDLPIPPGLWEAGCRRGALSCPWRQPMQRTSVRSAARSHPATSTSADVSVRRSGRVAGSVPAMSIEAASALVSGGYEIQRFTIDTQPETKVRIDLRSDHGSAAVVLRGVVDLEVRQQFSNWPFSLQFDDISEIGNWKDWPSRSTTAKRISSGVSARASKSRSATRTRPLLPRTSSIVHLGRSSATCL